MQKSVLTQNHLKKRLQYDPETGTFIWSLTMKEAGCIGIVNGMPYRIIKIDGKSMKAHRLAWMYFHGEFPKKNIDHIDGNGLNNSILNLREATQGENTYNKKKYKNNSSGIKGVSWLNRNKKWIAYVNFLGDRHYLGLFNEIESAAKAVNDRRELLHKEFANHG